jgi:MoCo/4Fe-4S cofactor protein with predicted Tat translocation signal
MKDSKKIYWKGIEQLANKPEFVKHAHNEFAPAPTPEEASEPNRRDFLKMMGFGVAAVSLAACEAPIRKAIPYVNKPLDLDPSIANYYASSYVNGGDYASIVVKTREGRPIKIEGNALSTVTRGGVSAQVEASVLSLYDNSRLRGPLAAGKKISWEDLDSQVIAKLNEIAGKGGQIRIVSNTVLSPSTKAVIQQFIAKYPTTQHIQYDQGSHYGIWKANEESFGQGMIPSYDFSKAKTIVSIAADFLNSWGSSIENTIQYGKTREVGENKKEMSRHYQFESIMSLTGANADYRAQIKPSQEGAVAVALYNLIAAKAGRSAVSGGDVKVQYLSNAAEELWANRGSAVVVAGSNDKAVQIIVNGINDMLGSYGTTILPNQPVNFRQGNDEAMAQFVSDLEGGKIAGVIFYNANPVYDHPMGAQIGAALKNLTLSVSTSYKSEETGELAAYVAPDHHFLEAWNDFEPKKGSYSLSQPAITPIFKSRPAQESFLAWTGQKNADYFEIVKENWKNWFFKGQTLDYQTFWDKCLYDGVFETTSEGGGAVSFAGNVSAAASAIAANYASKGTELVIYQNGTVGDGSQANNPLLQELPDPVTKAVWDHYVTVSPKDAADISFEESKTKKATITVGNKSITLPVLIQPGQAQGTIGVALGYGRGKVAGKVAEAVGGQNAYPLLSMVNGSLSYAANATFQITTDDYQIAQTQTHETYMGRQTVIQETTLDKFADGSFKEDKYAPEIHTWKSEHGHQDPEAMTMWKNHDYNNHHWGMAIDLNTCTGCAACVVACNVENNVSLVGRDEVIKRREMHWLRIDRYYSSDANIDDWKGLEEASDNPEVVFQPMMCQHCNNAPCETVCPVAATTHSTEGLNQMVYNRCIGTRYCANNCPYKVRRFNWFKYHDNKQFAEVNPAMNTDLGKMVLNPDVTVRSRGVMEKCSFCVQRIQLGKLNAKKERRRVADGEVVTACSAACSTGAIVFGDMNDPESKISKLLQIKPLDPKRPTINDKEAMNPRAYAVLEEINVRPNVFYLTKVRNKEQVKA